MQESLKELLSLKNFGKDFEKILSILKFYF